MQSPENHGNRDCLAGKTALVTGGSRGIGAAAAFRLAQEGARVALTYNESRESAYTVAETIERAGGEALVLQADANVDGAMPALLESVFEAFGRLDILVNNAGVFEGIGSLVGAVESETFERTLRINLVSVFELTQAAAKVISADGRIINISSVLGARGIFAGASAYAMSKSALHGFTRSWAWDLAPRRITVNSVEPGPIRTGMGHPDAAQLTALKRLGEPEEVAAVIAFLASPEAGFVTGAAIPVDGGVNA